jgi:putative glycosyltransferase (TIGR04372 family)
MKIQLILIRLLALPITLGILAISPWVKIRLVRLISQRIGHYALNTELLLCALDTHLYGGAGYKTFFYTAPNEPICNLQLQRMWRRVITILPWAPLWSQVDKFLLRLDKKRYRSDPYKKLFEQAEGAQDKWKFLEKCKPHLAFTTDEIKQGKELLIKLGIPSDAPFICLLARDSLYLRGQLKGIDWSYHDYRNVDINQYRLAAEFLAEQGYYVIRMGRNVADAFIVKNPRVIDYANHAVCSDFMDIYLSAHCFFFISPRSGIDAVAQIFRRPLLLTDFPLCDYQALYYLNIFITKKVFDEVNKRFLTFKEMCWTMDRLQMMRILRENKWRFVDNTPEEILAVVKEMLSRLTQTWPESSESAALQMKFWQTHPLSQQKDAKMRIGESFVKSHPELLND